MNTPILKTQTLNEVSSARKKIDERHDGCGFELSWTELK